MTRLLPTLSALALAAGLAAPAMAQTAAPTPAATEAAPPVVDLYTREDAQAVLDARLAALKTVIGLTPDQARLWEPVEAAIREAAKDAAARAATRAKAEPATDFLTVLDRIADAEATRAQDLKKVVTAFKPLVAALSPEQKRRIPAFLGMTDKAGAPQPTLELWIFEDEQE